MRIRWIGLIFAIVTVLALSPSNFAQTPQQPGAAKSQNGASTPDLTGLWATISKPFQTFNAKVLPSFQPWAEEKFKSVNDNVPGDPNGRVDRDPTIISCFPPGIPRLFTELLPFEIIQVPNRVIILFERDYAVQHIWTDGRKLPEDPDPTYMGYSVGKWDGDTLVVDTIGMKDTTWLDRTGHPHSDALHVTWRIRRISPNRLQMDWIFDDPKALTKPWTGQTIYNLKSDWILEEMISCEDRLNNGGESMEQKAMKEKTK